MWTTRKHVVGVLVGGGGWGSSSSATWKRRREEEGEGGGGFGTEARKTSSKNSRIMYFGFCPWVQVAIGVLQIVYSCLSLSVVFVCWEVSGLRTSVSSGLMQLGQVFFSSASSLSVSIIASFSCDKVWIAGMSMCCEMVSAFSTQANTQSPNG